MKTEDNRFPDVSDEVPGQRDDVDGRLAFHDGNTNTDRSDGPITLTLADGSETRAYRAGDSIYAERKQRRGYDDAWDEVHLGNWLVAREVGPRTQAEARALDVSNAGSAIPQPLQDRILDDLKENSLLGRTGMRTVPMESNTLDIARFDSTPGGGWKDQGSTISSTDPNLSSVQLNARSFVSRVDVSRETRDDAADLERALRRAFVQRFTSAMNDAILVGDGGSTTIPTGIANSTIAQTNFGSTGGATPAASSAQWGFVLNARQTVLDNEADAENLEMVTSPRVANQFHSLTDANNQPLQRPDVLRGVPMHETVSAPTTLSSTDGNTGGSIVVGDMSGVVAGMRLRPEVRVLDAGLREDWSFSFVGGIRLDVQFPRSEKLTRLAPITT